jgi:NAD dependent epimerase/dehydratase family enzyme
LKLLITGASGLLGTKLVDLALKAEHEVSSVYNQHPTKGSEAIRVDLRDNETVRSILISRAPDVVIHTASEQTAKKLIRGASRESRYEATELRTGRTRQRILRESRVVRCSDTSCESSRTAIRKDEHNTISASKGSNAVYFVSATCTRKPEIHWRLRTSDMNSRVCESLVMRPMHCSSRPLKYRQSQQLLRS